MKKTVEFDSIVNDIHVGERCKLVLTNNDLVRTSRVLSYNDSKTRIETLNTIYVKKMTLNLHQLSYEEKLEMAKNLKIIT